MRNLVLLFKEVDMMVAGISATAERERVVDFTFPFYHDSVRILYRQSGWIGTDGVNRDTGFDPGETLCLCVSTGSTPYPNSPCNARSTPVDGTNFPTFLPFITMQYLVHELIISYSFFFSTSFYFTMAIYFAFISGDNRDPAPNSEF